MSDTLLTLVILTTGAWLAFAWWLARGRSAGDDAAQRDRRHIWIALSIMAVFIILAIFVGIM